MRVFSKFWLASGVLSAAMCAASPAFAQAPAPQKVEAVKPRAGANPAPARAAGEGAGPFRKMVIRGAMLIDGTGAPPRGPVDIVVENNRIAEILDAGTPGLPMKQGREPRDFDHEIEAAGMWVLPGFIDTHVHGSSADKAPDLGNEIAADSILVLNRPAEESGHVLENAFDGKPGTWFRTKRDQSVKTGAHEFTLALGERRANAANRQRGVARVGAVILLCGGQLLQAALAHQVGARVSHMGQRVGLATQHQRGQRGQPHRRLAAPVHGGEPAVVGGQDAVQRHRGVPGVGRGEVVVHQRVHGGLRGLAAIAAGESQMGGDRRAWQWGKLHRYEWKDARANTVRTATAAGGDQSTLNAAAYAWGQDFNVTRVPGMRLIVDFAQAEPLLAQNGTGQSGNPASPNYLNNIDPWLKAQYQSLPMQPQNFDKVYGTTRLTLIPGK